MAAPTLSARSMTVMGIWVSSSWAHRGQLTGKRTSDSSIRVNSRSCYVTQMTTRFAYHVSSRNARAGLRMTALWNIVIAAGDQAALLQGHNRGCGLVSALAGQVMHRRGA